MASFNKVFLMGNLTRDPELKYTPSGTAVAEFGLAVNRTFTNVSGEKKDEVCFVDVSVFGRKAEVVNEYLVKGRPIFIEGRLKFDSWQTQDGQKRSKLRVVAENFQFIGRSGEGADKSGSSDKKTAPPPPPVEHDIDAHDVGEAPAEDIPF